MNMHILREQVAHLIKENEASKYRRKMHLPADDVKLLVDIAYAAEMLVTQPSEDHFKQLAELVNKLHFM